MPYNEALVIKIENKLLEKGIVEHPKYFKKNDLFEYDKTYGILETSET